MFNCFINQSNLEALKEKHARVKIQVRYDPETREVRIALPENLDGALSGEGEYTLEVLRGKLSRVKLNERNADTVSAEGQDLEIQEA